MLKVSSHDVEQFLVGHGIQFRRKVKKAELRTCPFCHGGQHNDLWTCVVYMEGDPAGNYTCVRGSCAASGNFWSLCEQFGHDPKQYLDKDSPWTPPRPLAQSGPHRLAEIPTTLTFPTAPDITEQPLTPEAEAYFQLRGLSPDLANEAPVWCDEKGNVNFGYYYMGELCMVKCRVPRKRLEGEAKCWQAWKGGLRPLWCIERADPQIGPLVIVFGEYDALALKQCGIPNVVSVPNGDNDLEWINICWEDLQKYDSIILWPDNDKSGHEALLKISERLDFQKLRLVRSPYKDPNEHLARRMREVADEADTEIRQLVEQADWLHPGHLAQLASVYDEERCYEGYTSGIEPLDKLLGAFFFGQLILTIGKTKTGKSMFVNQIVAQAVEQGGRACVWAGEDVPSDYRYKLFVHLAGQEGIEVKTSQRTGTEYASVKLDWIPRLEDYVRDKVMLLKTRELMTEDLLLEQFELAFKRYGCDVFVVDNLMKLVAGKQAENVWQRQAQIVNRLVDFAKTRRVTVHLVCHTNKTGSDYEPPTLKSNSGAQEIVNLCDRALFVWRVPEAVKSRYTGESVIGVLADRVFGNEGSVDVRYQPLIKRYGVNHQEITRRYSIEGVHFE